MRRIANEPPARVRSGRSRKLARLNGMSVLPSTADVVGPPRHVRSVPILLQKSKIEELRKSRESRLFDVFVAAGPCGIDTAAGGRFGVKRCGPSRRRVKDAPASLKNFIGQSKKTFSTLSAQSGQANGSNGCLLFSVDSRRTAVSQTSGR